jgi:hypothetical protein
MKILRRLLPSIILLGSLAGSLPARADDAAARKAAATDLLHAMHSEEVVDRVIDKVSQNASHMVPPGHTSASPTEEAAFRDSLAQQAKQILQAQLNWQGLEPTFVQSYADEFTLAELQQLVDFYKSPVGQKLLDKQPDIANKMTQLTEQKLKTAFPLIMQKLKASSQKFAEDHPPAPASPAPASPAPASPAPGASPAAATPSPSK